jgi:hypothetical protein
VSQVHARPQGPIRTPVKTGKNGGARRNRTDDLLHAMQALSQLSYGPILGRARSRRAGRAFQALIFILIVKNERIIIVIIRIDVERIIVIIIKDDIVVVIIVVDAFFGEASRHFRASCLFLVIF